MNPLKKRPWLLVVLAFIILISVWTAFIMLAVKNQPEKIPLELDHSKNATESQ